ncbi:Helix-turn-helix domain-containing protein [Pseudomonas sp. NFACC25]|jgi:hypothetical protein|uniref:helix-turn-helix domain-containing protein n=1 Tax=Pseudomonas sp. NFACC25 TaxID=1566188 RepID=UPI00087605E6|nr:helix-turn-helix domain-containing protein [Pseudomonas sp. NFACC25]SCX29990.1 Helix-turn-helix domain-containing protein [Pseudomonas sp. NFACC25]
MSEYIRAEDAATILGVSADTLRFWRYAGKHMDKIPPHKHISRRVFYKRDDVVRFSKTMYCPA